MKERVFFTYSVLILQDSKEVNEFLYYIEKDDVKTSVNLMKCLSGYISLGCSVIIKRL